MTRIITDPIVDPEFRHLIEPGYFGDRAEGVIDVPEPPYLREAYMQAQAKVIERDIEIAQLRLAVTGLRRWIGSTEFNPQMDIDVKFAERVMAPRLHRNPEMFKYLYPE